MGRTGNTSALNNAFCHTTNIQIQIFIKHSGSENEAI